MTNEEAIKILSKVTLAYEIGKVTITQKEINEALDMATKALEQQPCEDCISREEVMKFLEKEDWADTVTGVLALPSVQPQRKRGKWIEIDICNCHATLKCSACDRVIEPTFTFGEYSYEDIKEFYPFCHCGADMRGDKNAD